MGANDRQMIDGYLGANAYDTWLDLQRRLRLEKSRYERIVKKYFGVYDNGLSFRIDLAERLNFDYENGLKYILQGKKINKKDAEDVATLFELALDTIEQENDIFEAIQMTGLASVFILFPFALFSMKAQILIRQLEELKKLLEKARREVKEAWVQKGLDVGLTIVTFLAPELTIIEKFGVGALKIGYDHFLGPKQPGAKKVAKTTFTTYSGSISKVKALGDTGGSIVKTGGKVVKYYGLALDWGEVLEGYDNVDKIQAAMKATQKAYDALVKLIKENQDRLRVMSLQFEKAAQRLRDSVEEVEELKKVLREEVETAHYSSPKPWRFNP